MPNTAEIPRGYCCKPGWRVTLYSKTETLEWLVISCCCSLSYQRDHAADGCTRQPSVTHTSPRSRCHQHTRSRCPLPSCCQSLVNISSSEHGKLQPETLRSRKHIARHAFENAQAVPEKGVVRIHSVTGNSTDRQVIYDFLLVFNTNYVPIVFRFRQIQ